MGGGSNFAGIETFDRSVPVFIKLRKDCSSEDLERLTNYILASCLGSMVGGNMFELGDPTPVGFVARLPATALDELYDLSGITRIYQGKIPASTRRDWSFELQDGAKLYNDLLEEYQQQLARQTLRQNTYRSHGPGTGD